MKPGLALVVVGLLWLALNACAQSGKRPRSAVSLSSDAPLATSASDRYDSDDGEIGRFGYPAGAAEKRAIVALVRRYYAAAAAQDGAEACALTSPGRADSIPEDWGPTYLPGAKTCATVLTAVFKRLHNQVSEPVYVTGVRVDGDRAYALVGSTAMPASVTQAQRARGVWKIDRVLATPLP